MKHSFQLSGNSGVLSLTGSLTIEHVAELKASIAEALEAAENLIFDLSEATSADICSLQLLCSAHKAAALASKTLELGVTCEGFEASVFEAGYERHVGCMKENTLDCLWINVSEEKTEVAP